MLQAELKEVNKGIDNMLNDIRMGIVTESKKARLESLEADRKRIEASIAKEKMDILRFPKSTLQSGCKG